MIDHDDNAVSSVTVIEERVAAGASATQGGSEAIDAETASEWKSQVLSRFFRGWSVLFVTSSEFPISSLFLYVFLSLARVLWF